MQIVYCESCGRRISESDLENKLAFPLDDNRYTCAQCAPAGTPGTQPVPRVGPSTKARVQPTRSSRATSARLKPAKAQGGKALPPALLGVGALVLIAGLYFVFGGGREPVKKTVAERTPPAPVPAPVPARTAPPAPPAPVTPPPPVERSPAPETKSTEATPEAAQPSMADIRNELAAKNLAEAQAFAKEHPGDPWTFAEKLQDLARTYGSTPAGAEAAKTLAGLKLPPKPERVGSGDWETLFAEGKDPFKLGQLEGWRMVNGLLERNPAIDNSAQVKKVVTDGEFRIRFEWSGDGQAYFAFRQGRGGNYRVHFDKPLATKTKGKVNELIVLLDGKRCTATLNGETCSVLSQGDPDSGMIQFNTKSEMMRIHSIEQRGLAVKP